MGCADMVAPLIAHWLTRRGDARIESLVAENSNRPEHLWPAIGRDLRRRAEADYVRIGRPKPLPGGRKTPDKDIILLVLRPEETSHGKGAKTAIYPNHFKPAF